MTITIDATGINTFLLYLITALSGNAALGYFQVLGLGTTTKAVAILGLTGIVVQGAIFAFSKFKSAPTTPKV